MSGTRDASIDAVVVSQVCLFRECISQSLAHDASVRMLEVCATLEHALESVESLRPRMILLDAAFPGGPAVAARLRHAGGEAHLVAVALAETEQNILDWAEAGISGYVPDSASTSEIPALLRQILWGEQSCSSRIAGSLLRRVGRLQRGGEPRPTAAGVDLTPRERVILRHIGAGLTNKDIARQLDISLGTAKSHVHNIFGKLNLTSRAQVAARMGGRLGLGPRVEA